MQFAWDQEKSWWQKQSFEGKLSMEGLVRHTGWERLRGVNMKGQVSLGCGLGGSQQWIEIYTKKAANKAIRDTSQGQKPNERLNGWKEPSREEFRTEAGEKEEGEDNMVLCCDRVLGGGWIREGEKTAGLTAAMLLPSGFHLWGSISRGAEESSCSARRSVLLFPKEAGCQLPCALLVIPTDSVNGSAFPGMWSKCRSNKVWWEQELRAQWFFLTAFRRVIPKG